MKPHFRKSFLLTIITATMILSSCGKKNIVNSAPTTNASSAYSGGVPCLAGRYRLKNDAQFYVNGGSGSQSTIYGQFQAGQLQGTATETYVGVSAYRDIMVVKKISNGSTVVGYNVSISMCSIPNSYSTFPALVSDERTLSNFQAPYGIVVNSNTKCGYGLIAAAYYTYMVSQRIPSNAYTADFPVYTTFSNSGCL